MTGNLNEMFRQIIIRRRSERDMFYNMLYDRICVFVVSDKPKFIYNHMVKERIAKAAAAVQYMLEHEKLRLTRQYKISIDSAKSLEMNTVYGRITDLTYELNNLIIMMTASARMDIADKERRCIFRTFVNTKEANMVIHFIKMYNTWTSCSAEYLITVERQKHDDEKFCKHIEKVADESKRKRIEEARLNVANEYYQKLDKLKMLLSDYVSDLYSTANELNEEYGLLEQLEGMAELFDDSVF